MKGHGCWGGLQICGERGWSVENCPRQHGLAAFCSKPWKVEAIFEMWKEPCIDGPGCLEDPSASGMTGTNAVVAWLREERIERERDLANTCYPSLNFKPTGTLSCVAQTTSPHKVKRHTISPSIRTMSRTLQFNKTKSTNKGLTGRLEVQRERVVWRAPVAPHSLYQALLFAFDQMSSWYSAAGYGWLESYGSWYGRRRGRWNGKSEIHSDVEWFCLTGGTKVLSWNVAGVVFVLLISNGVDLEPGMTDCFHVGELILGPQLTDDLNDS